MKICSRNGFVRGTYCNPTETNVMQILFHHYKTRRLSDDLKLNIYCSDFTASRRRPKYLNNKQNISHEPNQHTTTAHTQIL